MHSKKYRNNSGKQKPKPRRINKKRSTGEISSHKRNKRKYKREKIKKILNNEISDLLKS